MVLKKLTALLATLIFFLLGNFNIISAYEKPQNIITPVFLIRDQSEWVNDQVDYLDEMNRAMSKREIPSTWLGDYDALESLYDHQLLSDPNNKEVGLLMEVTEKLALDSSVKYSTEHNRYLPGSIFLTGYTSKEKKRIIDTFVNKYKSLFGAYPKTVGAWYIDSESLNYLRDKYDIESVLLVAEQYKTDHHTIRGHWWQSVYYPSKHHPLIPAFSNEDKLDMVVFQWAIRDPLKGYGFKEKYSNFSVQANDYTQQGFDYHFFEKLLKTYIHNSKNDFNQLTVGIEVGQEGADYFNEFLEQLDVIVRERGNYDLLTTKEMAKRYKEMYPLGEDIRFVESSNGKEWSAWISAQDYRIGLLYSDNKLIIRDLRVYDRSQKDLSWMSDKRQELYRQANPEIDEVGRNNSIVLLENVEMPTSTKDGDKWIVSTGEHKIFFKKDQFLLSSKLPLNYFKTTKTKEGLLYQKQENKSEVANSNFREVIGLSAFVLLLGYLVIKKKYSEVMTIMLLIVFWFKFWSLTPFNGLGITYLFHNRSLLSIIYLSFINLVLPLLLFLIINKISKKIEIKNKFFGLVSVLLMFFPPSFGLFLAWYRRMNLDPIKILGIKTTLSPFIFNLKFSFLDKLRWAYSASGINIDFISNLLSSNLKQQVLGVVIGSAIYIFMTLGVLSIGLIYGLIKSVKERKYFVALFIILMSLVSIFSVNYIHVGLPNFGEIGLRLISVYFFFKLAIHNQYKIISLLIGLSAFLSISYLVIFFKQQLPLMNLWSNQWADRREVIALLRKEKVVDYFYPFRISGSNMFIPMGLENEYFVDYEAIKEKSKVVIENNYGLIVKRVTLPTSQTSL